MNVIDCGVIPGQFDYGVVQTINLANDVADDVRF